jgi:hypothetical protein
MVESLEGKINKNLLSNHKKNYNIQLLKDIKDMRRSDNIN